MKVLLILVPLVTVSAITVPPVWPKVTQRNPKNAPKTQIRYLNKNYRTLSDKGYLDSLFPSQNSRYKGASSSSTATPRSTTPPWLKRTPNQSTTQSDWVPLTNSRPNAHANINIPFSPIRSKLKEAPTYNPGPNYYSTTQEFPLEKSPVKSTYNSPVSTHEIPKEVPTKPIYPGEGQWAKKGLKNRPHLSPYSYETTEKTTTTKNTPDGFDIFLRGKERFTNTQEKFTILPKNRFRIRNKPQDTENIFQSSQTSNKSRPFLTRYTDNLDIFKPSFHSYQTTQVPQTEIENLRKKQAEDEKTDISEYDTQEIVEERKPTPNGDYMFVENESQSTKEDDFVPQKSYAQVRKVETRKHLPRSEIDREQEENADRLREVIKDSKIQTVYTEEGYEDSAYDHAGKEKKASLQEGHVKKEGDHHSSRGQSSSRTRGNYGQKSGRVQGRSKIRANQDSSQFSRFQDHDLEENYKDTKKNVEKAISDSEVGESVTRKQEVKQIPTQQVTTQKPHQKTAKMHQTKQKIEVKTTTLSGDDVNMEIHTEVKFINGSDKRKQKFVKIVPSYKKLVERLWPEHLELEDIADEEEDCISSEETTATESKCQKRVWKRDTSKKVPGVMENRNWNIQPDTSLTQDKSRLSEIQDFEETFQKLQERVKAHAQTKPKENQLKPSGNGEIRNKHEAEKLKDHEDKPMVRKTHKSTTKYNSQPSRSGSYLHNSKQKKPVGKFVTVKHPGSKSIKTTPRSKESYHRDSQIEVELSPDSITKVPRRQLTDIDTSKRSKPNRSKRSPQSKFVQKKKLIPNSFYWKKKKTTSKTTIIHNTPLINIKRFKRDAEFEVPEVPLTNFPSLKEIKLSPLKSSQRKDKKYPFYKLDSSILPEISPLRYSENLDYIPKKTIDNLAFYNSRSGVECPDIPDEVDPIPGRIKGLKSNDDVKENPGNEESGPRLQNLGDKIDCLKVKYFGKDPLDSPLFKEKIIGVPTPRIFKKRKGSSIQKEDLPQKSTTKRDTKTALPIIVPEEESGNTTLNPIIVQNDAVLRPPYTLEELSTRLLTNLSNSTQPRSIYDQINLLAVQEKETQKVEEPNFLILYDNQSAEPNSIQESLENEDRTKELNDQTFEDKIGNISQINQELSSSAAENVDSIEDVNSLDDQDDYQEYDDEDLNDEDVSPEVKSDQEESKLPSQEALRDYRYFSQLVPQYKPGMKDSFKVQQPNFSTTIFDISKYLPQIKNHKSVTSEVQYKDEIKPSEQLNVYSDVLRAINISTQESQENIEPLKPITVKLQIANNTKFRLPKRKIRIKPTTRSPIGFKDSTPGSTSIVLQSSSGMDQVSPQIFPTEEPSQQKKLPEKTKAMLSKYTNPLLIKVPEDSTEISGLAPPPTSTDNKYRTILVTPNIVPKPLVNLLRPNGRPNFFYVSGLRPPTKKIIMNYNEFQKFKRSKRDLNIDKSSTNPKVSPITMDIQVPNQERKKSRNKLKDQNTHKKKKKSKKVPESTPKKKLLSTRGKKRRNKKHKRSKREDIQTGEPINLFKDSEADPKVFLARPIKLRSVNNPNNPKEDEVLEDLTDEENPKWNQKSGQKRHKKQILFKNADNSSKKFEDQLKVNSRNYRSKSTKPTPKCSITKIDVKLYNINDIAHKKIPNLPIPQESQVPEDASNSSTEIKTNSTFRIHPGSPLRIIDNVRYLNFIPKISTTPSTAFPEEVTQELTTPTTPKVINDIQKNVTQKKYTDFGYKYVPEIMNIFQKPSSKKINMNYTYVDSKENNGILEYKKSSMNSTENILAMKYSRKRVHPNYTESTSATITTRSLSPKKINMNFTTSHSMIPKNTSLTVLPLPKRTENSTKTKESNLLVQKDYIPRKISYKKVNINYTDVPKESSTEKHQSVETVPSTSTYAELESTEASTQKSFEEKREEKDEEKDEVKNEEKDEVEDKVKNEEKDEVEDKVKNEEKDEVEDEVKNIEKDGYLSPDFTEKVKFKRSPRYTRPPKERSRKEHSLATGDPVDLDKKLTFPKISTRSRTSRHKRTAARKPIMYTEIVRPRTRVKSEEDISELDSKDQEDDLLPRRRPTYEFKERPKTTTTTEEVPPENEEEYLEFDVMEVETPVVQRPSGLPDYIKLIDKLHQYRYDNGITTTLPEQETTTANPRATTKPTPKIVIPTGVPGFLDVIDKLHKANPIKNDMTFQHDQEEAEEDETQSGPVQNSNPYIASPLKSSTTEDPIDEDPEEHVRNLRRKLQIMVDTSKYKTLERPVLRHSLSSRYNSEEEKLPLEKIFTTKMPAVFTTTIRNEEKELVLQREHAPKQEEEVISEEITTSATTGRTRGTRRRTRPSRPRTTTVPAVETTTRTIVRRRRPQKPATTTTTTQKPVTPNPLRRRRPTTVLEQQSSIKSYVSEVPPNHKKVYVPVTEISNQPGNNAKSIDINKSTWRRLLDRIALLNLEGLTEEELTKNEPKEDVEVFQEIQNPTMKHGGNYRYLNEPHPTTRISSVRNRLELEKRPTSTESTEEPLSSTLWETKIKTTETSEETTPRPTRFQSSTLFRKRFPLSNNFRKPLSSTTSPSIEEGSIHNGDDMRNLQIPYLRAANYDRNPEVIISSTPEYNGDGSVLEDQVTPISTTEKEHLKLYQRPIHFQASLRLKLKRPSTSKSISTTTVEVPQNAEFQEMDNYSQQADDSVVIPKIIKDPSKRMYFYAKV